MLLVFVNAECKEIYVVYYIIPYTIRKCNKFDVNLLTRSTIFLFFSRNDAIINKNQNLCKKTG